MVLEMMLELLTVVGHLVLGWLKLEMNHLKLDELVLEIMCRLEPEQVELLMVVGHLELDLAELEMNHLELG